jgi:hypothetical protein
MMVKSLSLTRPSRPTQYHDGHWHRALVPGMQAAARNQPGQACDALLCRTASVDGLGEMRGRARVGRAGASVRGGRVPRAVLGRVAPAPRMAAGRAQPEPERAVRCTGGVGRGDGGGCAAVAAGKRGRGGGRIDSEQAVFGRRFVWHVAGRRALERAWLIQCHSPIVVIAVSAP